MEQAIELAKLIVEIEPVPREDVEVAIIARFDTPRNESEYLVSIFEKRFRTAIVQARRGGTGWPNGCNDLWQDGMMRLNMMKKKGFFTAEAALMFEPDCVPMRPDWLNALIEAYAGVRKRGKWVMGHAGWIGGRVALNHINGNAVFPTDCVERFPELISGLGDVAWDIQHGKFICSIGENTDLIYQIYRMQKISVAQLKQLQKNYTRPCIFHGCKTMDAINGVREMMKDGSFDEVPLFTKVKGTRIYCYHEGWGSPQLEWLIEEWKRIARFQGWVPVQLGEDTARQHPRFAELDAIFASYPTVNAKEYELACWRRWMAMSVVGGGWMSDYDCIPYSGPQEAEKGLFIGDPHGVPCLVHGSREDYDAAIEEFIKPPKFGEINGKPHWSDMMAAQQLVKDGKATVGELVEECDRDTGRAFVHFSSRATRGNRRDAIIGVNEVRLG